MGLASSALCALPTILPSGRLFAQTGNAKIKRVVYVMYAGGVRHMDSVGMGFLEGSQSISGANGNVMEHIFSGSAPSDTMGVYERWALPSDWKPIQESGVLFNDIKLKETPPGHQHGRNALLTGQHYSNANTIGATFNFPSLGEMFRKHLGKGKNQSWVISDALSPLQFSSDINYGSTFGSNFMNPRQALSNFAEDWVGDSDLPKEVEKDIAKSLIDRLNSHAQLNFSHVSGETEEDRNQLLSFYEDLLSGKDEVEIARPEGTNVQTGDMRVVSHAWKVLQHFEPELLVLHTHNCDTAHTNYSGGLESLHRSSYAVGWLWNKIQSDPVFKEETLMVMLPECGRNLGVNTRADANGYFGTDHNNGDAHSRQMWALVAGPSSIVPQNQIVTREAASVDVFATVTEALGLYPFISNQIPGIPLPEAFI